MGLCVESRPLEFQKVDPSFYVTEIYSIQAIFTTNIAAFIYPVAATYKTKCK